MFNPIQHTIGGKPRKTNKRDAVNTNKRGKGTKKEQIIGYIEQKKNGKVVLKHINKGQDTIELLKLLKKNVKLDKSILVTDEGVEYTKEFDKIVQKLTVKHKEYFAKHGVNTNTIESFWAIIKRGITGQYHHLSKRYLPFYITEFAYRYNNRNNPKMFNDTLDFAIEKEKCFEYMKPKKGVEAKICG